MVGKVDYSSVPTAVDLENNRNHKKYNVNQRPNGGLLISKPLCTLMGIGALLLAVLVGLLVFFFVPRCSGANEHVPESLTNRFNNNPNNYFIDDANGASNKVLLNTKDEADERLPQTIEPTHYRLQLMPFLNNSTMNGAITISMHIRQNTDEIVLHAAQENVKIDEASVQIKSTKSNAAIGIKSQEYVPAEQKYKIKLDEAMVRNVMYTLELMYVGYLGQHLQGLYLSHYSDTINHNKTEMVLASTQFSPTDARRAFPCFDEPSFKANFSISIARLSNYSSLSNMPLEKQEPETIHPGWVWDHYKTTPKMSTYLVAFLVGNLQGYGSSDKLIKTWSRHESIAETRYAAEFAPKVLRFFENYFQIKFPLPKMDIVAVPEFGFNAMENWGLITFRESVMLLDERDSSIDQKRELARVMSHELAHQWFGNLVSPKFWDDLWLKEGFSNYLMYLGTDYAERSWKFIEEFILSETSSAFELDAYESSRPISFEVKNSQQIRQTFDKLSYEKGACLVRMMNYFLGEDTFKTGLIRFLQKYAYSNADRTNLFDTLTEEAHQRGTLPAEMTVNEIMDSWTKQAGYPVITAIADRPNNKLIISQQRFLFTESKNGTKSTWWVPISLTTDYDLSAKPLVWLRKEPTVSINVNFTENWYLLNINMTGHFIVNYDESNWRMLTQHIMMLPPLIRAQLISDSMDLAKANLLDYDIPLKMIARMAVQDQDIMYVPTSVAFKKLAYISNMLLSTPAYGLFEDFQSSIFKTTYMKVDSDNDYYSDNYLKQKIRRTVLKWSCRKPDSECAIRFHQLFRGWMERGLEIPANLRDTVYCTAIRQGYEAEWSFAYHEYLVATSPAHKNVLLDALGCTTKKWLLSRYLDLLAQNSSSIKVQDAARVFQSVAGNSVANSMAFDFLRMNWDELHRHYGDGFSILGKMVKSLSKYMNTEYQLQELISFRNHLAMKGSLGTTSQAFDSTIEEVRGNVEWMKRNYHSVDRWLNDHKLNYNLV